MDAIVIVGLILIFVVLVALFVYLVWSRFQELHTLPKINPEIQNQGAKIVEQILQLDKNVHELKIKNEGNSEILSKSLENLKTSTKQIDWGQKENKSKMERMINSIQELTNNVEKTKTGNEVLTNKMETLNNIFISNYQRGKLGEVSLYFILESILTKDSEVVHRQYLMKNGKRPDAFIKIENNNIPIDSKFPFDNFLKILELKSNTPEYDKSLSSFKKNIEVHIKKIAESYISEIDDAAYAVMYLPSQPIFDLIFSQKKMESIVKLANEKKIVILGPNTLPILLRLVSEFLWKMRLLGKTTETIGFLKDMTKEFVRHSERWNKLENRIDGLSKDAKNFSITTNKINKKFEEIERGKFDAALSASEQKKNKFTELK